MATEIFKDIPNYKGIYQISNLGRVKSMYKLVIRSVSGNFIKKELILKPFISTTGYLIIKLRKDNINTHFKIHRLTALLFIDNPKKLPEVNHINRNKLDNSLQNLEWVTARENSCHKVSETEKSSSYVGVSFCKQTGKWKSCIVFKKKRITIGRFSLENDAYQARVNFENENNIVNKYL
jgi:NUMOD4 motif/HNH endonuclease